MVNVHVLYYYVHACVHAHCTIHVCVQIHCTHGCVLYSDYIHTLKHPYQWFMAESRYSYVLSCHPRGGLRGIPVSSVRCRQLAGGVHQIKVWFYMYMDKSIAYSLLTMNMNIACGNLCIDTLMCARLDYIGLTTVTTRTWKW